MIRMVRARWPSRGLAMPLIAEDDLAWKQVRALAEHAPDGGEWDVVWVNSTREGL